MGIMDMEMINQKGMHVEQHKKNETAKNLIVLMLAFALMINQAVLAHEAEIIPSKVKLRAVLTPPYVIGPGDQIVVVDRTLKDVVGVAEQYNLTVSGDGYISIPLPDGTQENILAAGYTLDELSAEIRESFGKTLKNPLLFVQISRYRPINVYIGGEIVKPGIYKVESTSTTEKGGSTTSSINNFGLTLTEAIQLAGGLKPRADITSVTITRGNDAEKKTVNLKALLTGKEDAHDLNLQPGDAIYISAAENVENQAQNNVPLLGKLAYQDVPISVVGEVKSPANFILPNDATLLDAIGKAGGINNVGTTKKIKLSRYDENGVYRTYKLNIDQLLAKGITFDKIALKPNDVIELEASGGKEFRRFFREIAPNAVSIVLGSAAGNFGGFIVQDNFFNRFARVQTSLQNSPSSGSGATPITIIGGSGGTGGK